jgi:hypothetical protein
MYRKSGTHSQWPSEAEQFRSPPLEWLFEFRLSKFPYIRSLVLGPGKIRSIRHIFIDIYLRIFSTNASQCTFLCHVMSMSHSTHLSSHSSHSSKATSPRSTFPTLQISRSSSTSSFDNPKPPCPPSASFLSRAVFPSLNATRLK